MAAPSVPPLVAIPTKYLGIQYRSRLEARWAVLFTGLHIAFSYEPEGFELGTTRYLPDFHLTDVRTFAEVKPTDFTSVEKRKCILLTKAAYAPCLLLSGPPAFRTYNAVHRLDIEGPPDIWECDYLLDVDYHGRKLYDQGRLYSSTAGEFQRQWEFSDEYQHAVQDALSFRFDGSKW